MNQLKETREERSREESKENHHHPHPLVRVDSLFGNRVHHAWERGILSRDLDAARKMIGGTVEDVKAWLKYMDEVDWKFPNCDKVTGVNFRRSLRMWIKTERRLSDERGETRGEAREKKRREEAEAAEAAARRRREEAAKNPAAWELCRDRCLFAKAPCGCSREVECPPSMQPHPHPPEECPWFRPSEA